MSAFDRRSLLLGGATLLGGGALLSSCPKDPEPGAPATKDAGGGDDGDGDGQMSLDDVMPTLVAVCERLVPSDDLGPGVKEAGIDTYLRKALADPRMKAIKSMTQRGAVWVARAAKKEHGKWFVELDDAAKDALITRLVKGEVKPKGFTPLAFVRVLLALSLEAFLGDPRHGGNKDQVGWKFVGGITWSGRQG
ncbi:MAG: gluconate 2-dehydrogenase subunit 3 family protein [Deltaproteobacteria bacterium]|nr:gluconate 2-dehydrogenase subunit 3 family protein [Deltaproteobacteria bacterium]